MPDRAVIALLPTIALAFICGVIGAAYEMHGPAALWLGFAGAGFAFVSGWASVIRAPGVREDRWIVGLLRSVLDVAIFVLVYVALLSFLRDALLGLAIALLVLAGACALALARLRVRNADELGVPPRRPAAR